MMDLRFPAALIAASLLSLNGLHAQEKDAELQKMRLFVTVFFIERMQYLLGTMGIQVPAKM